MVRKENNRKGPIDIGVGLELYFFQWQANMINAATLPGIDY